MKRNADTWFSRYIRLRDSEGGVIKCISCGKIVPILKSDCGHYINRRHMSLRFSEINCNAQCRECNRFDEGNIQGYTIGLEKKYGKEIVNKLMAAKRRIVKFSEVELRLIAKDYRAKVKKLEIEKGFKF